jgi:hypothetical protein
MTCTGFPRSHARIGCVVMRLSSTFFTSSMRIDFLRLQYRSTHGFFYKRVASSQFIVNREEVAVRYLHARKKEKGIMLQEFCATTGYTVPVCGVPAPHGVSMVLPWWRHSSGIYHLAGELCGKRLQAGMPVLLSATLPQIGVCHHEPAAACREGGGKATGDHCYTLTVTDRCTGWTEIVPVPNRAQVHVFAALTGVLAHLAFPVQVLHSDNGSEFINDELRRYCDTAGIRFTRSRPYHKNDNCYVENRNWTLVRRCIGYHRFDTEEQLQDLTQLERLLALRANILQPSMALLQKVRTGSRIQKRYRPPLTPLRRLLQARLLGKTSEDTSLGAVTRAVISR